LVIYGVFFNFYNKKAINNNNRRRALKLLQSEQSG